MQQRFNVLRAFVLFMKIAALLFVGLTIGAVILVELSILRGADVLSQFRIPVTEDYLLVSQIVPSAILGIGFMQAFWLYAFAEFIDAHLSIEENTRMTNQVLLWGFGAIETPNDPYPATPPASTWDDPARKVLPRIDQQPPAPRPTRHQRG